MARRARPFTASGIVVAPDQAVTIVGVAYTGFTAVHVYNGSDNTGVLVAASASGLTSDTVHLAEPVFCDKGIYVEVAGTGKGSLHV